MDKMQCPRCHELYPTGLYQDPLAICLVCYSRIPANAGLTIDELRVKAKKSWRANNRNRKDAARVTAEAFMKRQMLSEIVSEEIRNMKFECDFCHEEFEEVIGIRQTGETKNCCAGCLPDAQTHGAFVLKERLVVPELADDNNSIATQILNRAAKRHSND